MSDPKNTVHHVFDGIEEQDNRLPAWWLSLFIASIFFSFGYWLYFEIHKVEAGPAGQFQVEMAALLKKAAQMPISDESLAALVKDPMLVHAGEEIFETNCVSCHGPLGQGKLGPNLTDAYWLHGGKPTDIHKVVAAGLKGKGMPGWLRGLGPERVRNVVLYVLSMRGKNIPGKPPQGELIAAQ